MFGLERKNQSDDELPVFVHIVTSAAAMQKAQRLWDENARLRYLDKYNRKELIRFTYAKPPVSAWLQRGEGTSGLFELVLHWKESDSTEVFILAPQNGSADDKRLQEVLQAMMVTPSVVPAGQQK